MDVRGTRVKIAEKLASLSWTFWLSLLAFQIVLTAVIHRLADGTWDVELLVYSGLGAITAIVLMRLWARRQVRNRPV